MWCEESGNLIEKIQAMHLICNSISTEAFVGQKLQHFAVDWCIGEYLTILAHVDRHQPLADIGDSPGERIACGDGLLHAGVQMNSERT